MNTDIRLFHGTSKKHLDSILRRGLQPRGTNPSTGKTSHQHLTEFI